MAFSKVLQSVRCQSFVHVAYFLFQEYYASVDQEIYLDILDKIELKMPEEYIVRSLGLLRYVFVPPLYYLVDAFYNLAYCIQIEWYRNVLVK